MINFCIIEIPNFGSFYGKVKFIYFLMDFISDAIFSLHVFFKHREIVN